MLHSTHPARKVARARHASVRRVVLLVLLVAVIMWLTWQATVGSPAFLWIGALLSTVVTFGWIAAMLWVTSPRRWDPTTARRAVTGAEPEQSRIEDHAPADVRP